jgi:hypothetical protein
LENVAAFENKSGSFFSLFIYYTEIVVKKKEEKQKE